MPVGTDVANLRAMVKAADEEFSPAIACHEAWKRAAFDTSLHARLGRSYAANTFVLVRQALRREMLLALLRVWDTQHRAVRMTDIAAYLGNPLILDAVAASDANGNPAAKYFEREIREMHRPLAQKVCDIIASYGKGGANHAAFEKVWALRNRRLAHRQVAQPEHAQKYRDELEKGVDTLYQDTTELIRLLFHVVLKTAYIPEEAAQVHARYAELFWASVCGERTEGHPNYCAPPGP